MNTLVINGNLTADIKTSKNKNGEKVVYFDIAHNRSNKKDEPPMYFHVVVTGKDADFAEKWLKRGSSVEVTGELSITENTKDDNKYVNHTIFSKVLGFYGYRNKKDTSEKAE